MENPIQTLEDKLKADIGDVEVRVRTKVETTILREWVRWILSRLATLDTARASTYGQALSLLQEE